MVQKMNYFEETNLLKKLLDCEKWRIGSPYLLGAAAEVYEDGSRVVLIRGRKGTLTKRGGRLRSRCAELGLNSLAHMYL